MARLIRQGLTIAESIKIGEAVIFHEWERIRVNFLTSF
jgi:hypothetical protein